MSAVRFAAAALAFLAMACAVVAALIFHENDLELYKIELTTSTTESSIVMGLWKTCSNVKIIATGVSASTCDSPDFAGTDATMRSGDPDAADTYWLIVQITAIAGAAFAFIAMVMSVLASKRPFGVVAVVAFLLAFLCSGFSGGWTYYILEVFFFKEGDYCDSFKAIDSTASCSNGPGIGGWLLVAAVGLDLIGFIIAIVVVCSTPKAEEEEKKDGAAPTDPSEPIAESSEVPVADGEQKEMEQQPAEQSKNVAPTDAQERRDLSRQETQAAEVKHQDAEADPAAKKTEEPQGDDLPELPEGDWEYDPDSGMYWSDENQLFLHRESGMFYDYNSGMWYNSETDEWFYPEE